MAIVKAQNLSKIYSNGKLALDNVNVEIKQGEMVGILGLSGSGKTTFFRLITGAISPTSGGLELFGQPLEGIAHRRLRELRQRMALVYQHHNVVPGLSVVRNVFLGLLGQLSPLSTLRSIFYLKNEEILQITSMLSQLGIADKLYQRATDLSGGQQQRVALARAFISQPQLVLADEPIASVDANTAKVILDYLQELNRTSGTTILMNLHQVDMALEYCTRVLVFNGGILTFDGNPTELPKENIYTETSPTERGVHID